MGEQTKIQWTDSTLNFWEGCTKWSPGCAQCYAEARDKRFTGGSHWGKDKPRLDHRTSATKKALAWNKKPWVCESCGGFSDKHYDHSCTGRPEDACHTDNVKWHRRRVFCMSLADWLDDEVPNEWRADLLNLIADTPNLDWQLLTKRPENWESMLKRIVDDRSEGALHGKRLQGGDQFGQFLLDWAWNNKPPTNVWIGTSVEDQKRANERIPYLLKIPAKVRFLSVEPLLGDIDFPLAAPCGYYCECETADWPQGHRPGHGLSGIHWVIVGGESGPKSRPCSIEWIRSIVQQCQAAGVPVFVKQLGKHVVSHNDDLKDWVKRDCRTGLITYRLKDPKGGDIKEFPEDLRIRQFPT